MLNGSVGSGHYGGTSQHKSTTKPGDVLSVIQTKYRISFKYIGECSCTGRVALCFPADSGVPHHAPG